MKHIPIKCSALHAVAFLKPGSNECEPTDAAMLPSTANNS